MKQDKAGMAICYQGDAGFVAAPPKGWANDADMAERFGVCAVYIPEGTTFEDAPAFFYPRAMPWGEGGGSLEETARIQAGHVQASLRARWEEKGPETKRRGGGTGKDGEPYEIWLFNQGPPPNDWEAAAYRREGDVLFMIVLSSRTQEGRDRHLDLLEDMIRETAVLNVRVVKEERQGGTK